MEASTKLNNYEGVTVSLDTFNDGKQKEMELNGGEFSNLYETIKGYLELTKLNREEVVLSDSDDEGNNYHFNEHNNDPFIIIEDCSLSREM